jgi:phosphatidylglycerol:prolipoprotein diacylglycerol transferase
MPDILRAANPLDMSDYTRLIGLGVIITFMMVMARSGGPYRAGRSFDVALAGLIGGIVLARVFHVALNWSYFGDHTGEIAQLRAGGLDWHGAVIGALLAMALVARLRDVDFSHLLGVLALALPLLAFVSWWGCLYARCSYGAEVDNLAHHPGWLVWEAPDIYNIYLPRYRTQALGMGLSAMLLAVSVALAWWNQPQPPAHRFWLMLALLSTGMFALGGLRGDFAKMFAGLRADQWLDLLLLIVSSGMLIFGYSRRTMLADL